MKDLGAVLEVNEPGVGVRGPPADFEQPQMDDRQVPGVRIAARAGLAPAPAPEPSRAALRRGRAVPGPRQPTCAGEPSRSAGRRGRGRSARHAAGTVRGRGTHPRAHRTAGLRPRYAAAVAGLQRVRRRPRVRAATRRRRCRSPRTPARASRRVRRTRRARPRSRRPRGRAPRSRR